MSVQVVPDTLANAVRRSPESRCVLEGDRSHTFAETSERAGRLAHALLGHGLAPGDRVGLLAMNELEYTEIQVACQRAGLTLVPLNYRLALRELEYMVGDAAPEVLIHGPGFGEHAAALGVSRTLHLGSRGSGDPYEALLADARDAIDPGMLDPAAACSILYTSGTTGRPKGAVISNLALWARMTAFAVDVGQDPGAVFLQCLPLFHIASNLGYSFTYGGGANVFVKMFSPEAVFAHLEEHRPTHVLLVPTMINMVLNHRDIETADWSSVEMVIYGASSIAPKTLERALDVLGCGFLQMYGMTETGGCVVLRPEDHDPFGHPGRLASAGTEATSFQTRIVDEAGAEVEAGTTGEIVTRGPAVMSGYWDNEEATAEAMRDGWMHTGDAGHRDEDGFVYVTDRIKDMIISGGENVYPREVEDVLYAHDGVLEGAVIGVPDERWGERVHAVVVARAGSALEKQALLEYCRAHLAGYKAPRSVTFVNELPKNATGKVLKTELRAPFWEGETRGVN